MNKAEQIEAYILERIQSGEYAPESQIQTENELVSLFGVSRMTVNKALSSLRSRGFLYSVRGRGTFVRNRPFLKKLNELTSFTEEMRARGIKPVTRTIEFTFTSLGFEAEKEQLGLAPNDSIYKIIRVRYKDKTPMALDVTILNEKVTGPIEHSRMGSSLYAFLENELGLVIDYSVQKISATRADAFMANQLEVAVGDPLLKISNVTYDIENRPIEVVHTFYVHDAYELEQVSTKRH